ncbi:MAG: DNA-protecting protein DprA [Sphingomonadales bacterium]|nr:DNA-protecting protein DprA [Sphingomonadales bacterium]
MNTNQQKEIVCLMSLLEVEGVGCTLARKIVETLGSASAAFGSERRFLHTVDGVGHKTAVAIQSFKDFGRMEFMLQRQLKMGAKVYPYNHPEFPARLRQCPDHPLLLFGIGRLPLNGRRVLAIVGTRSATTYGRQITEQLVRELAALNVVVLSGLALGIDGHAHEAAVRHRLPTIAVLGHGLGRIYPQQHRQLAERMLAEGGLLSEFTFDTPPERENFPKRNRIVAGMADAVVVVEAGRDGGALITASFANDYNRDVFAFPGRVGDRFSEGCHDLIRSHRAAIITSAAQLVEAMGWQQALSEAGGIQAQLFPELDADEQKVLELMRTEGVEGLDQLIIRSRVPLSRLYQATVGLEIKGLVRRLPGRKLELVERMQGFGV